MATLTEGQWEIVEPGADSGFLFGKGTPIRVLADGFDLGSIDIRSQDVDRPHADGLLMGRDYVSAPEWSLTIGVKHADVWGTMRAFQQAWRPDATRKTPGAMSVLRFRRGGVAYRALGRPRKFGIVPAKLEHYSVQRATLTFQLAAPEYYIEEDSGSANRRRLVLRLVEPPSDGGVVLPAELPWILGASTVQRTGEVEVGGYLPAPFTATIHGPTAGTSASGFRLSGDGWQIETSATLAYDRTLIIRTAQATLTYENGQTDDDLMESLTRKSRLTARLKPGHQFIKFEVENDPTGSAYAVIDWHDTVPA